jgi:uncharacterized membrane protein
MIFGTQVKFVSGLQWVIPEDLPTVFLSTALFSVPVGVFLFAWKKAPAFKPFMLEQVRATDMIAFHVCRVAGAAYIYMYASKAVNNLIVLQVGVFDLFISLTAIPFSIYVQSVGLEKTKTIIKIWNVIGIMDLVIPFCIFPFNLFDIVFTPNDSLSFFMMYPIIGIFLYNVPIALILHIVQFLYIDEVIAKTNNARAEQANPSEATEPVADLVPDDV